MNELDNIKGVDIYLLDQLMKGNIHSKHRILDAGCGKGRNLSWFLNHDMDAIGVDPKVECIEKLRERFPNRSKQLKVSTIEDFQDDFGFDVIICNAVLHFAKDHDHFNRMFRQLDKNLNKDGMLFIRMTSDIGLKLNETSTDGVYLIPDNSKRYLITREKIDELICSYSYELIEPVKTVNVNDLRYMTTLVFRK